MKGKLYSILTVLIVLIALFPWMKHSFDTRQRELAAPIANLYSINFVEELKRVQEFIVISEDAKMEDFELGYYEDGSIRDFSFDLIGHRNGRMIHSTIYFASDSKEYTIRTMNIDSWVQYDRLIPALRFFTLLDDVDLKKIKPETAYEWYVLKCTGEKGNFALNDLEQYFIEGDRFVPVDLSKNPIKGFLLLSYGMKRTSETSAHGEGVKYYFFDPLM